MQKSFMSVDRLASLLNKGIVNLGNSMIYVTGDPNEETGNIPQVILKSFRGVFSVDGVVVKAEKKVISGDRVFFVKDDPSAKDAIRAALTLIYQKGAAEARRYCDAQDEAFLAASSR
jgi:hypothetical protein